MAPHIDPSVPITLDRARQLRFTNEALREAELLLSDLWHKKVSILRVMFDPEGLGLNDITVLLLCALRADDPTLTLAQVDTFVTMAQLPPILEAIYAAWNLHTASADPAQEAPGGPLATPFPGTDSGALPASNWASVPVSSGA